MRGHETIIQMRKAGKAPGFIFINDYPCKTNWAEWGEYATVCTAGDNLADIDLRFVSGMRVSIGSESERRAKALFALAKQWGAAAVAACHVLKDTSGWAEVWKKD